METFIFACDCLDTLYIEKLDSVGYEAIEAIRDFKFYSYKTMLNRIKELNRITAFNKNWEDCL